MFSGFSLSQASPSVAMQSMMQQVPMMGVPEPETVSEELTNLKCLLRGVQRF